MKNYFALFAFVVMLASTTPFAAESQDCTNPNGQVGEIIRNATIDVLQGCTTYGWQAFHAPPGGGSPDTTPDAFTFADQTDVQTSTLITSNSVSINGIDASTPVSVSGDGSPKIRINGGSWATSGNIENGQTLEVRLTSNAANSTMNSATIDVGGVTDQWDVTTVAPDTTPDAFTFTDQTDVATSTVITSNSVTINGIDASTPVSVSGGGTPQVRINGGSWVYSGNIENGQTLEVRVFSSPNNSTARNVTVDVGGVTDQWDVTTIAGDPCLGSPSPGTTCADGSIFAGLSPDGNVPMYTTPADMPGDLSWNNGTSNWFDTPMVNCTSETPGPEASCYTGEANTALLVGLTGNHAPYKAAVYCNDLSAHGHSDWYLPAQDELDLLYDNHTAIGGFNNGWYWSSTEINSGLNTERFARQQRFSDGSQSINDFKSGDYSIRCVRR